MVKYEFTKDLNKKIIIEVNLTDIAAIPKFQPRKHLDVNLLRALKETDCAPAIHLAFCPSVSDKLILVDGNHRFKAATDLEKDTIDAFIVSYETELEVLLASTAANLNHGLRLNKKERNQAIAQIIEAMDLPDDKTFSALELSKQLQGTSPRELRKIYAWTIIRKIIGDEEATNLEIAHADTFFRILTAVDENKERIFSDEEFLNYYEKYKNLKVADLNVIVKKILNKEELPDLETITLDLINQEVEALETLEDEQQLEDHLSVEFLIKDLVSDLSSRTGLLKDFRKKQKPIVYYEAFEEDVKAAKALITELEELLKKCD